MHVIIFLNHHRMFEAVYQKFDLSPVVADHGGGGESSHHPTIMKSLLTVILEAFYYSVYLPMQLEEIVLTLARHNASRLVREVRTLSEEIDFGEPANRFSSIDSGPPLDGPSVCGWYIAHPFCTQALLINVLLLRHHFTPPTSLIIYVTVCLSSCSKHLWRCHGTGTTW